jgi:hypothetical protein
MCYLCYRDASSALFRGTDSLVPLCQKCAADWNFHGYEILKKINPTHLVFHLLLFKLRHPFEFPSFFNLYLSLKQLIDWTENIKKWKKSRHV